MSDSPFISDDRSNGDIHDIPLDNLPCEKPAPNASWLFKKLESGSFSFDLPYKCEYTFPDPFRKASAQFMCLLCGHQDVEELNKSLQHPVLGGYLGQFTYTLCKRKCHPEYKRPALELVSFMLAYSWVTNAEDSDDTDDEREENDQQRLRKTYFHLSPIVKEVLALQKHEALAFESKFPLLVFLNDFL
jgi:hypothetical protein